MTEFAQHVQTARLRATMLERCVGAPLLPRREMPAQTFDELYAAFTELKAVEEELRNRHAVLAADHQRLLLQLQCYQQVLEFVGDGYMLTDTRGNIQSTNRSAAAILNMPQHSLKGTSFVDYVAADDRRSFRADLARICQVDTVQEWSVRLQPRKREPANVTLTVIAIREQDATIAALHWLLRDHKGYKQIEEHVHTLYADLERRVVAHFTGFEAARRVPDTGVSTDPAVCSETEGAYREHPTGNTQPAESASGRTFVQDVRHQQLHTEANPITTVSALPGRHWPALPDLKNKFIYDLLHGIIHDEATILREARILGLDFTPPRAVILIAAADYILASTDAKAGKAADDQIRRRAQAIVSSVVSFFHLPNDTICAYLGDGNVAVLKASDTKNLVSWVDQRDTPEQASSSWANLTALKRAGKALLQHLRRDTGAAMSIGIGRYHPGTRELARSYKDARAALSLGRRFHGQNGVYCLDALGIAAFVGVSDEQTKIDLATHLLSPLNHAPELLETLDVFFTHNCCPSATATALSIHRNTLGYRLDKITALTGLNPRQFDDGVQIRLALALRSLDKVPDAGL